jgi:hypothetical protein
MLATAETALRAEYEKHGRGPLFNALATLVWGPSGVEPCPGHAARAVRARAHPEDSPYR